MEPSYFGRRLAVGILAASLGALGAVACGSESPDGGLVESDASTGADASGLADGGVGGDDATAPGPDATGGQDDTGVAAPDAGGRADAAASDGGARPDAGMSTRYQPIAVGATWTYHVVDPSIGVDGNQTITVQAFEDVGGLKAGTMAFRVHKDKLSGGYSNAWYQDLGTSVVIHHDLNARADGSTSDEEWYAPNRLRVDETPAHTRMGATWTEMIRKTNIDAVSGTVISNERAVWTVEAVAESVTVPAGTFTCLRVRRDAGQTPKTYWFAQGVGKVKESGGQEEELISYSLP